MRRIVMALEMSDNGKREHPQIRRSASNNTKVVAAQYDARRSVKGCRRYSHRRSLFNSLSVDCFSNLGQLMARQK